MQAIIAQCLRDRTVSVRVVLHIFYMYFIIISRSYKGSVKPHNDQNSGYHTPVQKHRLATPSVIKGQNSWFQPGQISKSLSCLTKTLTRAVLIQAIFQISFHPLYPTGQLDFYLITVPPVVCGARQ